MNDFKLISGLPFDADIKKSVININQAKEFKNLGFKQHSKEYWFPNANSDWAIKKYNLPEYVLVPWDHQLADWDNVINSIHYLNRTFSAYNIEELLSFVDDECLTFMDNWREHFTNPKFERFTEWVAEEILFIKRNEFENNDNYQPTIPGDNSMFDPF